MGNIKTNSETLIGGISQSPVSVRPTNKVSDMVNCIPSNTKGLIKRPGTEHIYVTAGTAGSPTTAPAIAKYHFINRTSTERYLVEVTPSSVRVLDASDGTEITTTESDTFTTYLASMTSEQDIELITIGDTTLIINKKETIATTGTTPASTTNSQGGIYVSVGAPKQKYSVTLTLNGTAYGPYVCETWDGNTATGAEISSIQTIAIAAKLKTEIDAGAHGITTTRVGSVLSFEVPTPATDTFSIHVEDGLGDTSLIAFTETVPRINGYLPEVFQDGFIIKIVGDAELEGDDYYAKFVAEDGGFSKGYWEECAAPGIALGLDASTMPRSLVGDSGGFTYDVITWEDRLVGDAGEKSNPDPSFVGRELDGAFFFKDRLGFFTGPNIIMSEQGEYYSFFNTTLLTLLDSDPIDVETNHTKITNFKAAQPLFDDMVFFTDRSQFILRGATILSPRTVQLLPITDYEYDPLAKPISTGQTILFPFIKGQHTGVRELFRVSEENDIYQAVETTTDVPDLIPGRIDLVALTTLENMLVCRTNTVGEENILWTYSYQYKEGQKVQGAWGRWDFNDGEPQHFEFIDNDLFIVMRRGDYNFIEYLPVATGLSDTNSTFKAHLDRRITDADCSSITYSSFYDKTTYVLNLSWINDPSVNAVVVNSDTMIEYQTQSATAAEIEVRGDTTGESVYIGQTYTQSVELAPPIVRLQHNKGLQGEYAPPQIVRYVDLVLSQTRYCGADVDVDNRPSYSYEYAGLLADETNTSIDSVLVDDKNFRIPVQGKAADTTITLENSTPYPCNFISAYYLINYRTRGRLAQ